MKQCVIKKERKKGWTTDNLEKMKYLISWRKAS